MNLKSVFCIYNNRSDQLKYIKIFNKTILKLKRKFKMNGKTLYYDNANHIDEKYIHKGNEANLILSDIINTGRPAMIGRYGMSELNIVQHFYNNKNNVLKIEYPEKLINEARIHPGIFNADSETLVCFSCEVLSFMHDIDVLSVWNCFHSPKYYVTAANIIKEYANPKVKLITTEPIIWGMFSENSWTKSLKGKKVLVISPFTDTIKQQYEKKELLFADKDILPDFELKIIKAPQGIGENNLEKEYGTWFNALNSIKEQMNNTDFDVCLIGAGAYGYHLAHHAKMIGKIGIHVAGALQLLFGIKGSRWINTESFNKIANSNWVFPAKHELPVNNEVFVKGEGCNAYW